MQVVQQLTEQFKASWQKQALFLPETGQSLTYGQLYFLAFSIGQRHGWKKFQPNTRLAFCCENPLLVTVLYLAALIFDVCLVPINPKLTAEQKNKCLHISRPAQVLLDDQFELMDLSSVTPVIPEGALFNSLDQSIPFLFFTSGTTGVPKGVAHYTSSLLSNAAAFNKHVGFTAEQRLLNVMPKTYMAGCLNTLLCPWMAGASVILAPEFNLESALKLWTYAEQGEATTAWLTPTMVAMLTRLTKNPLTLKWVKANLDHVFVGTAPLSDTVKTEFEAKFETPCLQSYGMSELLLVSSEQPKQEKTELSVGPLLPSIEIKTTSENQALWVHTPYALAGYVLEGEEELEVPLTSGWLNTGDSGELNAAGHLVITGRIKDLIIKGGRNICPRAIEEILLAQAGISEAAVVGVPHPFWGEEVVACLEVTEAYNEAELKEALSVKLDAESLPSRYEVLESLPRNSTGKIEKAKLKERLCSLA